MSEKISKLLRALYAYSGAPMTRATLELAPLVFVRPGELRQARWADIDLDAGEWRFIADKTGFGDPGFGGALRTALQQRADFLVGQGFAERCGQRVVRMRNLLATLRNRELESAAKAIATETGLTHRPVPKGGCVSGVYSHSVQLASGRFAVLQEGREFSLVPWRPVIEQRLGQSLAATVRGS